MSLRLGPIVGEVTATSAKIWFRTSRPDRYLCHVYRDPQVTRNVPGSPWTVSTRDASGCTGVARVTLPVADRVYYYDIKDVGGRSLVPRARGKLSFRSAVRRQQDVSFSFGLVSCNNPLDFKKPAKRYAMWDRMGQVFREEAPRFLIMAGDQIYADRWFRRAEKFKVPPEETVVDLYRDAYQKQWESESVMRVLGRYPTYMIWDDHEIRNGWGSSKRDGEAIKRQQIFRGARTVYHEFQHAHNPAIFGRDRFHYAFRFGTNGFLVLDLRGQRDIGRSRYPLLGLRQWRDITSWLQRNARSLRTLFVVTSVPLVHAPALIASLVPQAGLRDQWSHKKNRPEQRKLARLLFNVANDYNIQVVILGGDVHVGTVAVLRSSAPSHIHQPRIYQFTSSPINNRTNAPLHKLMRAIDKSMEIDHQITGKILRIRGKRNFGLIKVARDPARDTRLITFELYREGVRRPDLFSLGAGL